MRKNLVCMALLFLAGCAFDIIHVRQVPAHFESVPVSAQGWTLAEDVKVDLAEGFAAKLKKGTTWYRVGRVEQGDVFRTKDQLVTVEASNVYEAEPVISGDRIVGFYLVVEHTFTAAAPPREFQRTPD